MVIDCIFKFGTLQDLLLVLIH